MSEYHTGYRAFSRNVLKALNFEKYSNDFVFDNQMLADIIRNNFSIKEIACPCIYNNNSSSINFINSVKYGLGVLGVSFAYTLQRIFSSKK